MAIRGKEGRASIGRRHCDQGSLGAGAIVDCDTGVDMAGEILGKDSSPTGDCTSGDKSSPEGL